MTDCAKNAKSVEAAFARYHVGWNNKDAGLIASLHSIDTVFQIHDGTEEVRGREALRLYCIEMFKQFDFDFEMGRFFCGADHWVFEWSMILNLSDRDDLAFKARIEMLDLVSIDSDYLVMRKDVYMNGGQASSAFARAGIAR